MEYNNDFKFDLSRGKIGEEHLAKILEDKTLEVKTDSWIARTQNIAVEYESRGKPSGIATTEADYWVFVFDGRYNKEVILIMDTERLKKIARDYHSRGSIKKMGDNNTSVAVLIPLCELISKV
ncbi:hypothetical protein N9Z89_00645 [Akkermansiaceae bacterium]|jgi:hypothetical protein|nr:hypothetical protein [Akkermansiaceae bacterium]